MFQRIYDHFTTYETDIEILKLEVQGRVFIYQLKSIEQLRTSDILRIYELDSTCWLDMRNIGRREAIMTIFKSLILIFILGTSPFNRPLQFCQPATTVLIVLNSRQHLCSYSLNLVHEADASRSFGASC